jgi:hypothetical protein
VVSFDPGFGECWGLAEAGSAIRGRLGAELGFRMGEEGFSAMLALSLLPACGAGSLGRDVVRGLGRVAGMCREGRRFRFFLDGGGFPPDTDCTAVAGLALRKHGLITPGELCLVGCELLGAAAPGDRGRVRPGVPMVYWPGQPAAEGPAHGPAQDAVACANALCLLRAAQDLGMRDPSGTIAATARYVAGHLGSGRYLAGTRYYPSPEAFLFAASRLCRFPDLRAVLAAGVRQAITGLETGRDEQPAPLSLALRICAAANAGLAAGQPQRLAMLAARQLPGGAWSASAYYKLGRHRVYFGSAAITTLFAVRALQQEPAGE